MSNRFGGATEAILAKVAESGGSTISVANADTREAFLDGWSHTLSDHAKYLRSNNLSLTAPVVLIYVSDTGALGQELGWSRRSMLGSTSRDPFAGLLAIGTANVGAFVHPDKFEDTGSLEAAILAAGLESAPTIALTSESMMCIWPDGINGVEGDVKRFDRDLAQAPAAINIQIIDKELYRFYTIVARQTRKWWKNTKLRTTVENPEATVQSDLWVFLAAKYSDIARIKMEEVIGNGRSDITIVPINSSNGNQSAVLELKTLRDVRTPKTDERKPIKISKKENIKWAREGLQQTAAYRDDNSMDGAFLCLYDFCAGNSDDVLTAVTPDAIRYCILGRRYWIAASHEEHRENAYPLAENNQEL